VNALGVAAGGALSLFFVVRGASPPTSSPVLVDDWSSVRPIVPLIQGSGCPVVAAGSRSTGLQHISTGEIVPAPSPPGAKNGVLVAPGQTVFYAGPVPKTVDTAGSKSKTMPAPVVTRAAGDVVTHPTSTPTSTSHSTTTAARSTRIWTVQVASFEALDQAQELEQKLCDKGYPARIIGSSRPFTVRVGAYPTSDSAMVVARHLSSPEYTVFVTLAKR
jgi:hypothetical protein